MGLHISTSSAPSPALYGEGYPPPRGCAGGNPDDSGGLARPKGCPEVGCPEEGYPEGGFPMMGYPEGFLEGFPKGWLRGYPEGCPGGVPERFPEQGEG